MKKPVNNKKDLTRAEILQQIAQARCHMAKAFACLLACERKSTPKPKRKTKR